MYTENYGTWKEKFFNLNKWKDTYVHRSGNMALLLKLNY